MIESELLTPRECAAYRRCSLRKLDRERADGRGPPYIRDDRRIFYRRRDVDAFIEAHLCGGEKLKENHRSLASVAAELFGLPGESSKP